MPKDGVTRPTPVRLTMLGNYAWACLSQNQRIVFTVAFDEIDKLKDKIAELESKLERLEQ